MRPAERGRRQPTDGEQERAYAMSRVLITTIVGCAIALTAVRVSVAQQSSANATITDDQFVAKAAIGGSTEIALAKIALRQASNADVKQFAQQMISDHTAANQQLLTLAGRKQIPVPRKVDAKHQECVDKLGRLQGAEFDKEYAKQMVKDHKETVELFQSESSRGQDADLKAMATNLLPKLQQHLKMARNLAGEADDSTQRTGAQTTDTPK